MARTAGSVAVSVVPSAEGFAEKLRAQLGNLPSVRLVLDTAEATAKADALRLQLDEIGNGHARVDLDTLGAEAQVAAIRAALDGLDNKRVNVAVDDNGSSSSTGGAIAGAIGNASLASKAKIALIGEAILALIPLAAAAGAAVAGIGGGIAALGAGALVGGLAFSGIGGALSAANKAISSGGGGGGGGSARSGNQLQSAQLAQQSQEIAARQAAQSAADGVRTALEGQRAAENQLSTAQQNALQAQRDLNTARLAAKQTLEDLTNQVIDNGLAQRQAAISLAQAKQALDIAQANPDAANPVNAQAMAQLQLTFEQAKQQQAELALQGQRLAQQKAQADKAGVDGAKSVVQAQQKVHDSNTALVTAHQQVTDAARKLAEARQNVTDTAARNAIAEQQAALSLQNAGVAAAGAAGGVSAFGQAMAKLDPVQQNFVRFLLAIKPQLDALKSAAADSFLPLLQGAIQTVLPILPSIERILSNVGRALGTVATQAAAALTGPFWTQFFQFLNTSIAPLLVQVGGLVGNLFQAGAAGFQAFLPVITKVIQAASGLGSTFAATVSGGGLGGLVGYIASALPQVGATVHAVFGAVSAILQGLAPAAGPALRTIQLLAGELKTLAPLLSPLVAAFSRLLLQALTPLAPILTRLITALVPPLIRLLTSLTPIVPQLAQGFAAFVQMLVPIIPALATLAPLLATLLTDMPQLVPIIFAVVAGIKLWAIAQAVLNAVMDANPIALIILGIAALVVVVIEAYKHSETFRDIVNAAFQAVQVVVGAVVRWFQAYVSPVLKVVLEGLGIYFRAYYIVVKSVFDAVVAAVSSGINAVRSVISVVGGAVSKAWSALWRGFSDVVSAEISGVKSLINGVLSAIGAAINLVINGIDRIHIHIPKIDTHVPGAPTFGGADIGFSIPPVSIPRLADGAIFNPTADGTIVRIAEAGVPEAGIPLTRRKFQELGLTGGGDTYNVYEAVSASATARAISRRQKLLAV